MSMRRLNNIHEKKVKTETSKKTQENVSNKEKTSNKEPLKLKIPLIYEFKDNCYYGKCSLIENLVVADVNFEKMKFDLKVQISKKFEEGEISIDHFQSMDYDLFILEIFDHE